MRAYLDTEAAAADSSEDEEQGDEGECTSTKT